MNCLRNTNSLFAALVLTAASLLAQENNSPAKQRMPCVPIQEIFTMSPGYNAPSRIAVDRCWDVFTTGTFIYWSPSQENIELGILGSSDSFYVLDGKYVNFNPGYEPGFKVGLGLNLDMDHWDLFAEYTWFKSTSRVRASGSSSSGLYLYPSQEIPNSAHSSNYLSGNGKWKLNMDLADISLARHYYVGTNLMFHPFFGARGAFISQKLQALYVDEVSGSFLFQNLSVKRSIHSWGVGPRIGLSGDWALGSGFKMLGKGSADVLFTQYTRLDTKQNSQNSSGVMLGADNYHIRQKKLGYLRGHCDLEFGFSWGTYWGTNKWHTELLASYNFQIFFDQNMFRCFIDDVAHGIALSPSGNLYINGLNFAARFDF